MRLNEAKRENKFTFNNEFVHSYFNDLTLILENEEVKELKNICLNSLELIGGIPKVNVDKLYY